MANILRRPPNWKAHWLEDKVWRGLAKPRKSAIARAIAAGRPTICFIGDGQLGNRFDYAQEARHLGWSVMEAPVKLLPLAICSDTARSSKRAQAAAHLELTTLPYANLEENHFNKNKPNPDQ